MNSVFETLLFYLAWTANAGCPLNVFCWLSSIVAAAEAAGHLAISTDPALFPESLPRTAHVPATEVAWANRSHATLKHC